MRSMRRKVLVLSVSLGLGLAAGATAQELQPASAALAAKTIDLSQLPLEEPAQELDVNAKSIAALSYEAKGSVEKVTSAFQKRLKTLGWKELEGASITEAYANAAFQKDGFTVNLSVIPNAANETVLVSLLNQGNIDLKKLPIPSGAKQLYAMPSMLMLEHNGSADATIAELKKGLAKAGWEPFGDTTATFFVKKNAVRLQVMVSPAPTDAKKSMIQISSEQLSADFPALPDVTGLQYSSTPTQLSFDSPKSQEHWVAYFEKTLGEMGWKPTTEAPIKIDFREDWIFRNPRKEMLEIEFSKVDGNTRMRMLFQTAAQVDEMNKKADLAAAKMKAKREEEMKKKANPTAVLITNPSGAKLESQSAQSIEFSTKSGAAQGATATWIEKYKKDGWEVAALIETKEAAEYELSKGDITLRLGFVDPGFIPGSITVSVSGDAKLELKK